MWVEKEKDEDLYRRYIKSDPNSTVWEWEFDKRSINLKHLIPIEYWNKFNL